MNTFLVCGLGNPGNKYEHTRHNAGRIVIEEIARRYQAIMTHRENLLSECSDIIKIGSTHLILALPTTYMNDSGRSVSAIARYYKIPPEQIIIIQDDLDLPMGTHRASFGSQASGHHGIESIIEHLGTKDIWRIRLGITTPAFIDTKEKIADSGQRHEYVGAYVLDRFTPEEEQAIVAQASSIMDWLEQINDRNTAAQPTVTR